jgi:tRNA G10  N-methylase Trm11
MQTIAIFGRQPALGLAELESLLGAGAITPLPHGAALIDVDPSEVPFARLGGTVKLAKVLTTLDTTSWPDIQDFLVTNTPAHAAALPEGKLTIGLSSYGLRVSPKQLHAAGLSVKKAIRTAASRPVRLVPNTEPALSSAQVLHNHLTEERGWELILIKHGQQTILAQTTHIQDIGAYAARDQARPARDARVGMLPPKLAQIIINLASGEMTDDSLQLTVLDPFCGTGVVLQEALLMGYHVVGSDLEPRMIEYTGQNLEWLSEITHQPQLFHEYTRELSVGDATNVAWPSFDTIACETYLGRPFTTEPRQDKLAEVMRDVDTIHRKFLQNVARQTQPGQRMCIAVPAWHTTRGIKHLQTLEKLGELGYTRIEFAHARTDELIYHREGQVVGRELVVLVRK